MIVDNESQVRSLLAEVLSAAGHEVVAAADGRQALDLYRPGAFGVVMLDLAMPGFSGLDLARALRQRDAAVAIVLMTGWGSKAAGRQIDGDLIDLVVAKPLDLEKIRELVCEGAAITAGRRRRSRAARS
jgi:CheY-like chemotaxis protein